MKLFLFTLFTVFVYVAGFKTGYDIDFSRNPLHESFCENVERRYSTKATGAVLLSCYDEQKGTFTRYY